MGFLLWFIIGILVDRYLFPVFDILRKAYDYKIATFIHNESLSCKKKEFEFTKEINEYNKSNHPEGSQNLIGFKYTEPDEEYFEDDFDDDSEEDDDKLRYKKKK